MATAHTEWTTNLRLTREETEYLKSSVQNYYGHSTKESEEDAKNRTAIFIALQDVT